MAMPRLYEITIPGLSVSGDLPAVRRRLLSSFPGVVDVLATIWPATLLIAYRGQDQVDAWLDALSDSVGERGCTNWSVQSLAWTHGNG
jgi:hypothetical protein